MKARVFGPMLADVLAKKEKLRLVVFHNCDEHDCETHGNWAKGRGGKKDEKIKKREDPGIEDMGVPTHGDYGPEQWLINEKKGTAKPQPGSDAWLDAHNISREVFNDRPYYRFEGPDEHGNQTTTFDDLPPEIQALYAGEPEAARQLNKIMKQSGGFIMVRKAVPGSPEAGVVPQTRPDVPIVTDQGKRERAIRNLSRTEAYAEDIKSRGPEGLVKLQEERIEKGKKRLEEAKTMTREKYLEYATNRVAEANAAKEAATAAYLSATGASSTRTANQALAANPSGEAMDAKIAFEDAKKDAAKAKRTMDDMTKDADFKFGPNGEKTEQYRAVATRNAEKSLVHTERRLEKYKNATAEESAEYFEEEVERAEGYVKDAKQRVEDTAVKYVFPPNPSRLESEIRSGKVLGKAGRVNAHMDENIDRLVNGKGRVYLAMEGCMKEDSLLTAVKAEGDETSAVVSVPSVTLWRNDDLVALAKNHLQGREVVLIPDADGVNNDRVTNEARAMQSLLQSHGVRVVIAPPPIPLQEKDGRLVPVYAEKKNAQGEMVTDTKKVMLYDEEIKGSPMGTREELKGVDDYLGVGRDHPQAKGTLGNLAVQGREIPVKTIQTDVRLSDDLDQRSKNHAENALLAISNILGEKPAGRVGTRMLGAAIGTFHDNGRQAGRTMGYLESAGMLKIEYVFDPDQLAMGKRVRHPLMSEERLDDLVKSGVIDRPAFEGEGDEQPVELGMKETPIVTLAKKYRAAPDPDPVPLSSLRSSELNITSTRIESLKRTGKTMNDIADMLGVSEGYLNKILKGG